MSGMELSSYTCGDVTQSREFNFVSPGDEIKLEWSILVWPRKDYWYISLYDYSFIGYPVSIGLDNLTCSLAIDHGCGRSGPSLSDADNSICQVIETLTLCS